MGDSRAAIEIRGVWKTFGGSGGRAALRDVNISVMDGDFYFLLGPNGSGKTTLLNVILGLVAPDAGRVAIFGEDPNRRRDILKRVNFIPANRVQHPCLTVRETLLSYAKLYGAPASVVDELIDFFDLGELAHRRWWTLSTGEQCRVMLAKALVNRPSVLLLDEPTLGLDPKVARGVREELRALNGRGLTILSTTQNMAEAEELAETVGFIKGGRVLDERRKAEVAREYGSLEEYWLELEGKG